MRHFVFDAYGTLFDVHSAASRHADAIGPRWERLSQIWRIKHLEYTWIHAATGKPATFWQLAERSLDFAAATTGGLSDELKGELLSAYRTLGAYPEVASVLSALRARGATTSILTNGDPDMIADAVAAAGLGPAARSRADGQRGRHLQAACRRLPPRHRPPRCAAGRDLVPVLEPMGRRWRATAFGFRTVWINRAGAPDEYPDMPAGRMIATLSALPDLYA